MAKLPPHDFEGYAAFISRRTREEDSKSSIIPKVSDTITKEEYYGVDEFDDMEPAEITIDDEQNTMNIDLNLNAYTDFTDQEFTFDTIEGHNLKDVLCYIDIRDLLRTV